MNDSELKNWFSGDGPRPAILGFSEHARAHIGLQQLHIKTATLDENAFHTTLGFVTQPATALPTGTINKGWVKFGNQ